MTLGQKLRQTRLSKGLSQSQVAGDCVTRNMLSQIENDQASPSMRTLEHLAQALGVSVGWLLSDEQTDAAMERMPLIFSSSARISPSSTGQSISGTESRISLSPVFSSVSE